MAFTQLGRLRRFRIPVIAVIVLAAIALGYPGGLAAAYESVGDLPRVTEELQELHLDRARLEREGVVVANRVAVKEALIEDLIAGRLTLLTVAERFTEMNSDAPNAEIIRQNFQGENELERNANNVLAYAQPRMHPPSVRELLTVELHRQFRHRFGRDPASQRP